MLTQWERDLLIKMFVENELHPLVTLQSLTIRLLQLDGELRKQEKDADA